MAALVWLLLLLAIANLSAAFQQSRNGPIRPESAIFSGDNNESPFFVDVSENTKQSTSVVGDASEFGQSVPYVPPSQGQSTSAINIAPGTSSIDETEILRRNRTRNIAVAIASFGVTIMHYIWQLTHPVTAVEILATMQTQSAPLTSIGNNGKPTVIDFWAPWCENCKVAAPTLKSIEEEYGDRVNFIMVNGDEGRNWPLIQLFGVDAIPHLALLSDRGDVETALIGPMSRNVLRADIDALLAEKDCRITVQDVAPEPEGKVCHEELPFIMYDAFGGRSESRRINFVEK